MIQNSKESLTELNVLLFMKLGMPVQHLLIDSGLQRKCIVLRYLSQSVGKGHMIIVLLIIPNVVVSLNYQMQVETSFSVQVASKKEVLMF